MFGLAFPVQSQTEIEDDTRKSFSVFTAPHFGFVIPHRQEMLHMITGHSKGIEINAEWKTDGSKDWHQDYNSPRFGLDFYYSQLGNAKELGEQYQISFYLRLLLSRKQFSHHIKFGIGPGYSTKVWDLEDNTKAIALSSRLNAALIMQYGINLRLSKHITLRPGVRLNHFSNGSFKTPNLGTNNLSLYLGVSYNLKPTLKASEQNYSKRNPRLKRKIRAPKLSININFGGKELAPPGGPRYLTSSMTLLADSRFSAKSSFGLGLDAMYNQANGADMLRESDNVPWNDVLQLGAFASYSLHFNRFELKIIFGAYLYDKYKKNGTLYNRVGLRYRITDHLFASVYLKSHLVKADYNELGIGWNF